MFSESTLLPLPFDVVQNPSAGVEEREYKNVGFIFELIA